MSNEEKYKLALFMIIRNFKVLPIGLELQKSQKEISKMTFDTMQEILKMVDFNFAKKLYEEGKKVDE